MGQFVVIEPGAYIGENAVIGHHTTILANTWIGDNVTIGCHCVLGVLPANNHHMQSARSVDEPLWIGSGTQIGNLVTLYAGSSIEEEVFVADSASIRERVQVGRQSVIGRNAVVERDTSIGARCTIQTLAYVTGDTTIESGVFIGPCVSMSNDKYMGLEAVPMKGPTIRRDARIGNNASLLPGVDIGNGAMVGAGAVVTRDVPAGTIVVGSPAQVIRHLRAERGVDL